MTMMIKPRDGLVIPDPQKGDHLPPEGREVEDSPYWRRRLRDKSISLVQKEATKNKEADNKSPVPETVSAPEAPAVPEPSAELEVHSVPEPAAEPETLTVPEPAAAPEPAAEPEVLVAAEKKSGRKPKKDKGEEKTEDNTSEISFENEVG